MQEDTNTQDESAAVLSGSLLLQNKTIHENGVLFKHLSHQKRKGLE
jgi:hypothetical protein